jgi:hypothetical protein
VSPARARPRCRLIATNRDATNRDATLPRAGGEMPDDGPMFCWAGYGVAMAAAHDTLKTAAGEVTLSHGEDGITLALERLSGARATAPGDGPEANAAKGTARDR